MNIINQNKNGNEISKPETNEKEKQSRKSKSFYIALIICITAVSAATWSTYKSVKEFVIKPKNTASEIKPNSKSESKKISQPIDKTSILEENKEEKEKTKSNKLIPYDIPKENDNINVHESSEEIQAVSAPKSDIPIIYPSGNNITKEFSDGKPIYSKTMSDWRSHDGADFKAEPGSLVKSISDGIISDIYDDPSYGITVVVEHDAKFTAYYSGLDENKTVEKGQRVSCGQNIGTINKVPCEIADEPHLHLAISKDDKFIDPLIILDCDTSQ